MVDKTPYEACALAAALRPLGEVAAEIGIHKSLAEYSREEAITLIEAVVDAWQHYLLENPQPREAYGKGI